MSTQVRGHTPWPVARVAWKERALPRYPPFPHGGGTSAMVMDRPLRKLLRYNEDDVANLMSQAWATSESMISMRILE